jgi:hypothetical protein
MSRHEEISRKLNTWAVALSPLVMFAMSFLATVMWGR